MVADDGHFVGAHLGGGLGGQAHHHHGFARARGAGNQVHAGLRQGHAGAAGNVFELVAHSRQRFVLAAHVFNSIEQQGAQPGGHAGLGERGHQVFDFDGEVQAGLPAGGFLAQADFAAQAGEFVTDQVHDFAAAQVVALVVYLGQRGLLAGGLQRAARRLGLCQVLRKRHRGGRRGKNRVALVRRRHGGVQRLLVNVQGHDQLGLAAHGVVGNHQHVAAIQRHGALGGALGVVGEDAF